jgi:hypothetical protein
MKIGHFFLLLSIGLTACNESSVHEDMDRYCDCLQKNKTNQDGREECLLLMEEILQKYEYDPEALQEILKASEDCH